MTWLRLIPFLFCFSLQAQMKAKPIFSGQDVLQFLKQDSALRQPPPGHPDALTYEVLQGLSDEKNVGPDAVIKRLESLLQKNQYVGLVSEDKLLALGTVGSFSLWRDMVYLLLGRAYLAKDDFEKAVYFYNGVPEYSPFANLALIEKTWSYLGKGDLESAKKIYGAISFDKLNKGLQVEHRLQQSFMLLKQGSFEEVVRQCEKLKEEFKKDAGAVAWHKTLNIKILAQAYFEIFLKDPQAAVTDKKASIEKILKVIEEVPAEDRDAKFSFLAGEAYWHKASLIRIEDPVGKRAQWISALKNAEGWLIPWADKSIKGSTALMEEEAFFFSAVVLWEQERQGEAIDRLVHLSRLFPRGEYREDSYQLIGDFFFERKNYAQAIKAYKELVSVGSPDKATYGQFKASWSFYNLNDKKKALDHIKRLVSYYRNSAGDKIRPLESEAERDMILFFAEGYPYEQAIAEMSSLKYTKEEWPEVKESLAHTYKEIGRYKESARAYTELISKEPQQPRTLFWLQELNLAQLSGGNRPEIPKTLSQFAPALLQNPALRSSPEGKEFEEKTISLILTIHREGRKTDDKAIWAVTDELYDFFFANLGDSQATPIWYHGAQRKEALGKNWEAVSWYQREATIKESKMAEDAAQSVLRVLKAFLDKESISEKPNKEIYSQATEKAWWYIQTFPESKEKPVADLLFMEACYNQKDFARSHSHLLSLISEKQMDHVKGLFERENRRLYRDHKWDLIYNLSQSLLAESLIRKDKVFADKLKLVQQEAAFQIAFTNKENLPLSRTWYEKALEVRADESLFVKSWYNLMQTYKWPADNAAFLEKWKTVGSTDFSQTKDEDRQLLFDLYIGGSQYFQKMGRLQDQARAMLKASQFSEDSDQKNKIYWESAVLFGSYYDVANMEDALSKLKKYSEDQEIIKSRLLYFNAKYDQAWKILKSHLAKTDAPVWLLVSDLLKVDDESDEQWYKDLRAYLNDHYGKLKDNVVMTGAWPYVFGPELLAKEFPQMTIRAPASSADTEMDLLKGRLQSVQLTLGALAETRKMMKPELESNLILRRVDAACYMPGLSKAGMDKLSSLKEPALAIGEWKVFVKKLDEKISELTTAYEKEVKVCEEARVKTKFLKKPGLEKWCPGICNGGAKVSYKSLTDSDIDVQDKKLSLYERVIHYLSLGATATAEFWAGSSQNEDERNFLYGLIRFSQDDIWNAAGFMETIKDKPKYKDVVLYLQNRWATGLGDPKTLPSWAQSLN